MSEVLISRHYTEEDENDEKKHPINSDVSYWKLVRTNKNYRLFISSYLITHFGEWLTYIASIDFIEEQLETREQSSRTSISILIAARLLPIVILSSLGGTLADAFDRRRLMIALDTAGAFCALLFVVAYQLESIPLVYVSTFLQQSIAGLYQPSSGSIIPLLAKNDKELTKATTLAGLAWSSMTAFGAAGSGFIVAALGSRTCFLIDSATYIASALLLYMIDGEYNVATSKATTESPWKQFQNMTVEGTKYVYSSFWGALILLKAFASICCGACDVLNVALSEIGNPTNSNSRVGILFSAVGIGCLLGPLLTEPLIDIEKPNTVQLSCVLAYGLSAVGYFGWCFQTPFWSTALIQLVRAAGSSIVWTNSTLLLQKFSNPQMLGRVLAADYALALLAEVFASAYCGLLMDKAGFSVYQVSYVLTISTAIMTGIWGFYHVSGRGAGKYDENAASIEKEQTTGPLSPSRLEGQPLLEK